MDITVLIVIGFVVFGTIFFIWSLRRLKKQERPFDDKKLKENYEKTREKFRKEGIMKKKNEQKQSKK